MDLGAIDWRRRFARRVPAALLGAQLWLTATWLTTLSRECYGASGRACPIVGDPAGPLVLGIALVTGSLGWLLAVAIPADWLGSLADSVPSLRAIGDLDRRSHVGAALLLAATAVLAPRLFLGELGVRGLAWGALAVPTAPSLVVLFGSLTLWMLANPIVGDVPVVAGVALVLFLLGLAAVAQVAFFYSVVQAVRRGVALVGRRIGQADGTP